MFDELRRLMSEIAKGQQRLIALRARAERTTPVISDMPHGQADGMADVVCVITELETHLAALEDKYKACLAKIEQPVEMLSINARTAMRMRYWHRINIRDIADALGLDYRHTQRIIREAEKQIDVWHQSERRLG